MMKQRTASTPIDRGMPPLPDFMPFVQRVKLARSGFSLFLYDMHVTADTGSIPMLFVHGLGDEADTWRHVLPALAAQRRVVAVDLPGFGRSDKPDASYSVPWLAGVLLDLLDTLALDRVVLVGHSLGAIVSHWLALEQPGRLARLALLNGGLVAAAHQLDLATAMFLAPGIGEWFYTRLRKDPQAAFDSLRPYYANLAALPEADRTLLFERVNQRVWSNDQRRAFFRTFRSLARWLPSQQRPLRARLATVTIPTDVLWGEQDRVANVKNGRALATLQPGVQLAILPGVGHNIQQEAPSAVIEVLAQL